MLSIDSKFTVATCPTSEGYRFTKMGLFILYPIDHARTPTPTPGKLGRFLGNLPAGNYRLVYRKGAVNWGGGWNGRAADNGRWAVYWGEADTAWTSGQLMAHFIAGSGYGTEAAAEAASLGQYADIAWGGGNAYIWMADDALHDNQGSILYELKKL